MKSINVKTLCTSKNLSVSNMINNKVKFPYLTPRTSNIKLIHSRNSSSFYKNPLNTDINDIKKTRILTINPDLKMVKILHFDEEVDHILNTDLTLEREKEKIDKNKRIRLIRLGLYKKKEKDTFITGDENKGGFDRLAISLAELERENEQDLEKKDEENRKRERKLSIKLKEYLNDIEQLRSECQQLNSKINDINKLIEEYKIEESVLINYGKEIDNIFHDKIKDNKDDKENIKDIEGLKKSKSQHYDKLIIYKNQNVDKKNLIQENILIKQSAKQKLKDELNKKRYLYNNAKKHLYKIRKELVNSFHLKLYEGLEFKGEGLVSIIKDIWNLGVNVNINFMPSYLDDQAIDFLFKKAQQSLEINKILKVIKENESELASYLKGWKTDNKEIKNILNKKNLNKVKADDIKKKINEKELFKTKISDMSLSYLEPYPKTKQFMLKYIKKHSKLFHRNLPEDDIKYIPFKSLNIPLKITEKSNHLEKLKYLLDIKIEQNKQKDRKEVERLNKEFIKNGYKEKYEVNVETILGALFGEEKKNEMLMYYTRLEKEYRNGEKIIQFHTKLNLKLK